jgi:hypothetical protein
VLEQRLDGVVVLRRGGAGWGARAARVWSGKERGDRAAMAALIATREREKGPWAHPHGGGRRKGVQVWTARGLAAAATRGRRARAAAQGRRCRVAHGRGRGSESGSWQVGWPRGWAPPVSERRRERERADRWVWAARGPGFKWIQK